LRGFTLSERKLGFPASAQAFSIKTGPLKRRHSSDTECDTEPFSLRQFKSSCEV
jgi:hypothetical protein